MTTADRAGSRRSLENVAEPADLIGPGAIGHQTNGERPRFGPDRFRRAAAPNREERGPLGGAVSVLVFLGVIGNDTFAFDEDRCRCENGTVDLLFRHLHVDRPTVLSSKNATLPAILEDPVAVVLHHSGDANLSSTARAPRLRGGGTRGAAPCRSDRAGGPET